MTNPDAPTIDAHAPVPQRRMRSADRRKRLLGAAVALIRSDGLAAVTMERVASRAHVSRPVLYTHFPNRTALLISLLEQHWQNIDVLVEKRLPPNPTLEEQYLALLQGYFDALELQGPGIHDLIHPSGQEAELEWAQRQRFRSKEQAWSERYQRELNLPQPVADITAAIIRGGITSCGDYWLTHPGADRDLCIDTGMALIKGALAHIELNPIVARRKVRRGRPPASASTSGLIP